MTDGGKRDSKSSSSSVPEGSALDTAGLLRHNALCDQFEQACKQQQSPILEDFLKAAMVDDESRSQLARDLIELDVDYRRLRNEKPEVDDYLDRFPGVERDWLVDLLRQDQVTSVPTGLLETQSYAIGDARASIDTDDLERIGEYRILGLIGRGGMGSIYRAHHEPMDRVVALKTIKPAYLAEAKAIARFQREVRAAGRLAHPNIVRAYDAGERDGVYYLVMEYIDGTDLDRLVRNNGPLSVNLAVDYLIQAASGLHAAHADGVFHRDVKPSNVLVDHGGTVKVLDMGLARLDSVSDRQQGEPSQLTGSHMMLGTASYMAPEQAMNVQDADARADVYSLGCTLYFLLTGKAMYEGDSFMQIVMAHQQNPIPSLSEVRSEVPRELDEIFRRMVAKSPEDRYGSMSAVIESLRTRLSVDASEPFEQTGEVVCRTSPGSTNRRRAVAKILSGKVAAMIFLVIGTAAGIYLVRTGNLPDRDTNQVPPVLVGDYQLARTIRTGRNAFRVAFAPHSPVLAVSCGEVSAPFAPATVKLYNYTSGKQIGRPLDHDTAVLGVAFHPDGKSLATANGNSDEQLPGYVTIWDVSSQREKQKWVAHSLGVGGLGFTPDGALLATTSIDPDAGEPLKLWTSQLGKLASICGPPAEDATIGADSWILNCSSLESFRANRGRIAQGGLDRVLIWNAPDGQLVCELEEIDGWVVGLSFHPNDAQILVTGGETEEEQSKIGIWDADSGKLINCLALPAGSAQTNYTSGVFSPDGRFIVAGDAAGFIWIWSAETGRLIKKERCHEHSISSIAWCPDGGTFASAARDGEVHIWQIGE